MMLIGFGVGFELPLVVFYLIGLNIVSYDKIRGGWRYAYVVIIIVASVATPDWSPWTMGGLAGALILLYEGSLGLSRIVFSKRIKEQRKAEKEYEEYVGGRRPSTHVRL
jgi:sec-independent protein translocase protein TatC